MRLLQQKITYFQNFNINLLADINLDQKLIFFLQDS